MTDNYFLEMIRTLRKHEEVILYGNVLHIQEKYTAAVTEFLQNEYQQEMLEYPAKEIPIFDPTGALWAAQTVYIAAQLLLHRENKESDLELLLPDYNISCTPSSVLSVDICLRFLPDILTQLKMIDSEDAIIINLLERKLLYWHYSGINYELAIDQLDLDKVFVDTALKQAYINRIIMYKKTSLANHALCKSNVEGNLGMFSDYFWKIFSREKEIDGKY